MLAENATSQIACSIWERRNERSVIGAGWTTE